jgi:flagellar protein FliO/FliZ
MKAWLVAGLLLCAVGPLRAADDIIYPRAATVPAAGTEAPSPSRLTSTALAVIGLAGAGGWLLWRRKAGRAGLSGSRKLAIAETLTLGNRQYLVVAVYGERKYLIGVCQGQMNLIANLESGGGTLR